MAKYLPPRKKKKDNRAKYAAVGAGVLIVLGIIYYFFSGSSSATTESATPAAAASATPAPTAPGKIFSEGDSDALIAAQQAGPAKSTRKAATVSSDGEESNPAKPEFPGDVAKWTPDNYRLARKKRAPRLVQAVRQLGRGNDANPDASENAHLLAELLSPGPETTAPGYRGRSRRRRGEHDDSWLRTGDCGELSRQRKR